MTTRRTKSRTIVQVRETKDLIIESYSHMSDTDLLIEKATLSEAIRTQKYADTPKYERRLAHVESLLSALNLQAA